MESKPGSEKTLPPSFGAPVLGVVISGCSGRMGRRLSSLVLADPTVKLLGGICRSAARNLVCNTRQETQLNHFQDGKQKMTDHLPVEATTVSNRLQQPDVGPEAGDTTGRSTVLQKRKQVENDVPICASLDELLALPEINHCSSNPTVVIDFSHPAATMALLQACVQLHIPVIVGTTGFNEEQKLALKAAAKEIPLCVAANFSVGMNLLIKLAGEVTTALGEQFDIELIESHHNLKVDAPSGTAISLLDSINQAKKKRSPSPACASKAGYDDADCENEQAPKCPSAGVNMAMPLVHGRVGTDARRKKGEIGVHSLRLGGVVGEHSVIYASVHERVVLQHHAESRDVFAVGALKMAKWLASKSKGEYSINDMIFEKFTLDQRSRADERPS